MAMTPFFRPRTPRPWVIWSNTAGSCGPTCGRLAPSSSIFFGSARSWPKRARPARPHRRPRIGRTSVLSSEHRSPGTNASPTFLRPSLSARRGGLFTPKRLTPSAPIGRSTLRPACNTRGSVGSVHPPAPWPPRPVRRRLSSGGNGPRAPPSKPTRRPSSS